MSGRDWITCPSCRQCVPPGMVCSCPVATAGPTVRTVIIVGTVPSFPAEAEALAFVTFDFPVPAFFPGWYHTSASMVAHCFTSSRKPLCEQPELGEPLDVGRRDRQIGELCQPCKQRMVDRLKAGVIRNIQRRKASQS